MKIIRYFAFSSFVFVFLASFGILKAQAQIPKAEPQMTKNIAEAKENTAGAKIENTVSAVSNVSNETKENEASVNDYSNLSLTRVGIQMSQTQTLSLNEAIRRALENNNDIEVARDDVRFQETQLRSLLGAYDPILSLSPTFSRSSSTSSTASNDFRLNAGFDKLIQRGGGNISSFFNNSQTGRNSQNNTSFNQTSGLGTSSSTTYISNLGVNYTQPLFRDFKIDNTRRQIKIQRKRLQQSDADFRRQTIEIISRVQRAYWDLVFALRDQQNRAANLNLARENLRQVEARITAGSAAPLARAEVSTELASREGDVLLSTQQVSITENTLKTLLLRDPNSPEWSQAFMPIDKPVYSDEPIIIEDALKDALDNRPELRRLRLQREINVIDIDFFKNQTKPRIDLNSTVSLGGLSLGNQTDDNLSVSQFSGNEELLRQRLNSLLPLNQQILNPQFPVQGLPNSLNGGAFRSLQNLFRSDALNYSVGVTFQIPLRNQTAKANLAGAEIQQNSNQAQMRSQEQIVISEVRNAVQAVETARQRVLTARRARESAEIQIQGERKLFDVGRSTTFLLFQRENALTNARNAVIRAETDYNKALSDLQRATSTTFRFNNIEVDSPVDEQK
ncbi:MAG: TolC family protein [Acidobacteria bacterium]|nr:TolC family protein [Acidobacteriota bacterium]